MSGARVSLLGLAGEDFDGPLRRDRLYDPDVLPPFTELIGRLPVGVLVGSS